MSREKRGGVVSRCTVAVPRPRAEPPGPAGATGARGPAGPLDTQTWSATLDSSTAANGDASVSFPLGWLTLTPECRLSPPPGGQNVQDSISIGADRDLYLVVSHAGSAATTDRFVVGPEFFKWPTDAITLQVESFDDTESVTVVASRWRDTNVCHFVVTATIGAAGVS